MKSFFSKIFLITLIFSVLAPSVSAASRYKISRTKPYYTASYQPQSQYIYDNRYGYTYPTTSYNPCSNLSSVSVGIGTLPNGVTISIVSSDYTLANCIKNMSWTSYFTRFGNSVRVDVSNTNLGVQIIATSYDSNIALSLQNTGWANLITGNTSYCEYGTNNYSYAQDYAYSPNYNYYDTYQYHTNTYQNTFYTPISNPSIPTRTNSDGWYRTGTSVLGNTSQIARSLSYITGGVQMNFTSPDYNTMMYLQRLSFTNVFSRLSWISITQTNIGWGTQVTVTSGSSSSVQEIQNMGYYIVYQ